MCDAEISCSWLAAHATEAGSLSNPHYKEFHFGLGSRPARHVVGLLFVPRAPLAPSWPQRPPGHTGGAFLAL